ncbi:transposase, Ptta/En/Spm, transposase, Tnp1/En/Spm-like protein [Tanacetum coccineum]
MAAPGGANQIARRVIDDLIEFSGETSVDAKNLVGQLNALITEKEALEDQGEIFDTLMDLKDDREVARTKLQGLNEIITQAEQEIEMKEAQTQAMNGLRYGSILNILQGRNELLEKIIGIMETEANNLDDLVTYDNDNDIDDLGYESELYLDEEKEEDENNHSNRNVVKRGITRLSKFRREYGKPDGIKLSVTFDALNRISRKHRALFLSFLGDLVCENIGLKILSWKKVGSEAREKLWDEITRYFDVDLTVRKLVMNRLGQLLRNFRRKLRQKYIFPNQNTLSKLNEVPTKYSAILKAEEWVNFVKYMTTDKYKVKSAAAKMARSKSVYQHTMGRGGYAHVKEKMIEDKEIEPDEEPPRSILWLKGRVDKDGEFPDDEIRSVGDKLKETKDKIKEGTLKVDHGTDAMTVVLGKEKGGYARGVGSGVTYKSQLDNERRKRQEKELEIQNLSNKMSQTERMVTKLMNQLAAQGEQLKSMSTQLKPPDVSPVDINPIDSSADKEGGIPVVGCENDASIQKSNGLATSEKEMETRMSQVDLILINRSVMRRACGGWLKKFGVSL